MAIHRASIRIVLCSALGALFLAAPVGRPPAIAADLGYHYAPRPYLPPSPCDQYDAASRETLASMRATARLFRVQLRQFNRLKRVRHNDGFVGPDISLNAAMSAEQIDIATKAAFVATTIAQARLLDCRAAGRLNAADNEAFRLDREVAQEAIWIDPRTFW